MLKFLQISDLHLGAMLSGHPDTVADQLRDAVREVVRGAFELVRANGLELVLMPGDLYEAGGIEPEAQLRFVYQLAAEIDPVPVVIAPGNHDPFGPDSPYATVSPAPNIYLFTEPGFQVIHTPVGDLAGRAFQAGEGYARLDWASLPPPTDLGLLVIHASVLSAADDRSHQSVVVPVTEDAVLGSGYKYTALGHYHNQREFRRGSNMAYAAYSGCPQGQGWDEHGPKGYITGKLDAGGAELDFHPAARHQFTRRQISLPADYERNLPAVFRESLDKVAAELDPSSAVDFRFHGRWPESLKESFDTAVQELLSKAWHARPADFARIEFSPELVAPGQSEVLDEFLARCNGEIAGAEGDAEATAAWELALYIGHRLLSGQGLPGEVTE